MGDDSFVSEYIAFKGAAYVYQASRACSAVLWAELHRGH